MSSGEHGKPARQAARDEFPATARVYGGGVLVEMQVSKADYEAMCDRIDTLTAQVDELLNGPPPELGQGRPELRTPEERRFAQVVAERDSLRAERDTLTAEVERLNANNVLLHTDGQQLVREIAELTRQRDAACLTRNQLHVEVTGLYARPEHEVAADLRSLRAAVARWAKVVPYDHGDHEGWRKAMEAQAAATDALIELVPLDGSWETEQ